MNNLRKIRKDRILRYIGSQLDKLNVPQEMRNIEMSVAEMKELVDHLVEQNVIYFDDLERVRYARHTEEFLADHFDVLSGYSLCIKLRQPEGAAL